MTHPAGWTPQDPIDRYWLHINRRYHQAWEQWITQGPPDKRGTGVTD